MVCKKASLLISLVLLFVFFNNHSVYGQWGPPEDGDVWWVDQSEDAANHLWNGANNWAYWDESIGDVVLGNEPNETHIVFIGKGVLEKPWPATLFEYTIEPNPVIDANMTARCYDLWGPGGSYESQIGWYWFLDIKGGSLTIGDMNAPKYWTHWEIAGTDGTGEVTMTGGVVNVAGDMVMGNWGGLAYLYMTGGEINVKLALCMPGIDSGDGENCEATGTLSLGGGTIRCGGLYMNEWVSTSAREPITGRPQYVDDSTIDLAGGTLIIDGSYTEHIAGFVADGYITIYGLEEGDIAPDGRRAYVKMDYDAESDTTTVMGAMGDPNCAYNPNPMHYAKDLPVNTVLDWSEGDNTIAHDIYIGTDFDEVSNADTSDLTGIFIRRQSNDPNDGGSMYIPPELWEMDTTYYWRIDEFDGVNLWPGRVWCFKIGNYYSVDDFDSYADNSSLEAVWNDSQVNDSGAVISIQDDEDFDPAGNEMDFFYDNRDQVGGIYVGSVADVNTPALGISPDWTTGGLTTALGIYFYGDSMNSATDNDQIYAAVKDTSGTIGAVEYDGEMTDILEPEWHEWNIDLQLFVDQGVDITSIAKFYIGFGGPHTGQTAKGGNGTVYFNDIRLYATRCLPEKCISIADLTGDCVVNLEDFEIMAGDWLLSDSSITVVTPPFAPQLWYRFDEGTGTTIHNDGELPDLDGIFPLSDPKWVTPGAPAVDALEPNFAMYFDGKDDYVEIDYSPELSLNDFTVSAWIKLATEPYGDGYGILGTRVGAENTFDLKVQEAKIHGDIGDGTEWINIYVDIRAEDTGTNGQGGDLDLDTWYLITYVIDNTNQEVKLYLDGDLKKTIALSGTPLLMKSEQHMWIGQTGYSGEVMDGLIDDVRIYKQALSQEEVLYLTGAEGTVFFPVPSPANITDPEPPLSRKVNLADFAIVADHWLEEILWP